jgi:hypothetical protein
MKHPTRRDLLGLWLGALTLPFAPPFAPSGVRAQDTAIPEQNRASLTAPPPRPGLGDLPTRMENLLLRACVPDDPAPARELFLPRDAFRLIKAITEPDALYDRLVRAYDEDIHELHERLREETGGELASVSFVRFRFTGRRGWVRLREEANRLPYWAQRHSWIDYRAGGRDRSIEVRTMIAWGDRWFITHLNEFRH